MSNKAELKGVVIFNLKGEEIMWDSIDTFKYMSICHEEVHFNL